MSCSSFSGTTQQAHWLDNNRSASNVGHKGGYVRASGPENHQAAPHVGYDGGYVTVPTQQTNIVENMGKVQNVPIRQFQLPPNQIQRPFIQDNQLKADTSMNGGTTVYMDDGSIRQNICNQPQPNKHQLQIINNSTQLQSNQEKTLVGSQPTLSTVTQNVTLVERRKNEHSTNGNRPKDHELPEYKDNGAEHRNRRCRSRCTSSCSSRSCSSQSSGSYTSGTSESDRGRDREELLSILSDKKECSKNQKLQSSEKLKHTKKMSPGMKTSTTPTIVSSKEEKKKSKTKDMGKDKKTATSHSSSATIVKESTVKKVKGNTNASLQAAAASINAEIKRVDKKTVMEDENIVVYQDVYSVVYRNFGEIYKAMKGKTNKLIEEAKQNLTAMLEEKSRDFNTELESLVNQNMNRIRQATVDNAKHVETHGFVLITPKPQDGLFHITTAFDSDDLAKKMNRCKNVDKLVLKFDTQKEFNVSKLKDILKEKNLVKSKNGLSFSDGNLKDLQKYLAKIINSSAAHRVTKDDYSLTYYSPEKTPVVVSKKASSKKKVSKKADVVRSRNEEYSSEEEVEVELEDRDYQNRESEVSKHKKGGGTKRKRSSVSESTDEGEYTDQEDEDSETPRSKEKQTSKKHRKDSEDN